MTFGGHWALSSLIWVDFISLTKNLRPMRRFACNKLSSNRECLRCVDKLVRALVVCTKGPKYKIAATAKLILKKSFCYFHCFELRSPSTINPELTLSSVLMKDQHIKAYFHINPSLRLCGQNLYKHYTSSNYNTNLESTWANSDMPIFRGQACFSSWTTTQKTMQMDDKLVTDWSILPPKKLLRNRVYLSHFKNLLYIHLSMKIVPQINN